jgi:uncharacterized protein
MGAWIDRFTHVGMAVVAICGVLAVIAWLLDYLAGMLGARRAGASRQAIVGAAVGTVAGLFLGFVGVLFMPLVGAAIGQYLADRDRRQAVKVGVATWLGMMAGMVAKVVIAFVMVGVYVGALIL